jgi:hypothetical protein|tara:strand:+ start:976 stop:1686 length:711 start_codon:yes stop_codon:yes gene_type:complete
MKSKIKVPNWVKEGPEDMEYRLYRLKSTVSDIKKRLNDGNLIDSLNEIDDALDFLYRYDAVKVTHEPNPISQIVSGFELPNLELVFSTGDDIETDDILDVLLDDAIDEYESLHTSCREQWRIIESGLTCNYVPSKPYFLNDGFVFIKTPDNMMHVYHFIKPNKYFTQDWKKFNMTHIQTEKWTDKVYFQRIEELIVKDSDKIIIRAECKTDTVLENNAMGVINQMIYSMLHRDYNF